MVFLNSWCRLVINLNSWVKRHFGHNAANGTAETWHEMKEGRKEDGSKEGKNIFRGPILHLLSYEGIWYCLIYFTYYWAMAKRSSEHLIRNISNDFQDHVLLSPWKTNEIISKRKSHLSRRNSHILVFLDDGAASVVLSGTGTSLNSSCFSTPRREGPAAAAAARVFSSWHHFAACHFRVRFFFIPRCPDDKFFRRGMHKVHSQG